MDTDGNAKRGLRQTGNKGVEWIYLAQDRNGLYVLARKEMNTGIQ
jgi:hypothetical protein